MLPDYSALAEAVQRWALLAGVQVDHVLLSYHERPVLVLPLTNARQPDEASDGERGRPISQIRLDILAILEELHKPLTTTQLLAEMSKRRMEWSQRAVSEHLAEMVRDDTLENPEGVKPRGYRVPA